MNKISNLTIKLISIVFFASLIVATYYLLIPKNINQLEINFDKVKYYKYKFKPLDENIDNLIIKGVIDMFLFLNSNNFKNPIISFNEKSISLPIIYKYSILNIVYVIYVFIMDILISIVSND
jgi:hypothetical protein